MQITLVVPGLLSLDAETLASSSTLSRIATLAAPAPEQTLDAALLAAVALDAAVAPLAARGAGLDVAGRWVIRADPITMSVGRDDARLHGYVHDLDDAQRAALLDLLNTHFASDDLVFTAPRADAWFATSPTSYAVDTTPAERAAGQPLRSLLPSGPDAKCWRRWLTEAQMLLHEHSLADREAAPVNGVWFASGGTLPDATTLPALHACAAPGRHGDVLRGLALMRGEQAVSLERFERLLEQNDRPAIAVVTSPVDSPAALFRTTRDIVEPALAALNQREASAVKLIADGAGRAASWHVRRPSWLARLARRRIAFVAPAAANDRSAE